MRTIYVIISKTGTVPARLIGTFSKASYSHSSLSLNSDFSEMYSFARRKINNPFYAGFIKEDFKTGIFNKYNYCNCIIYALDVTDESYNKLTEMLKPYIADPLAYKYSILGLFTCWFNIKWERKKHFVCSGFISKILNESGCLTSKKDPRIYRPIDFMNEPQLKQIYQGAIKDIPVPIDTSIADNQENSN